MKYLRKFASEAEYNAAETLPTKNYVSLVGSEIKYDQKIAEGVYIQHIDGKLYTTDAWSAEGFTNEQANGVAIVDERASFVIAKNQAFNGIWSSNSSDKVDGVLTTSNLEEAQADYSGLINSQLICATDTRGAVYSCTNYVFPNGKAGYLPSLGEMTIAFNHKEEVNIAMVLIGNTFSGYDKYWTSTQYSKWQAWRIPWSDGKSGAHYKDYSSPAWPFTTL